MVEHRLAKARVASSNLVFRSSFGMGACRGASRRYDPHTCSHTLAEHSPPDNLDVDPPRPTQVELEIPISAEELAAARGTGVSKARAEACAFPASGKEKFPARSSNRATDRRRSRIRRSTTSLPEVYAKAVREHDLEPVDRPKMEVLEEEDGRPRRLKATVEVRPAIELGEYKRLAVSRPAFVVTDDDVDAELDGARQGASHAGPGRTARRVRRRRDDGLRRDDRRRHRLKAGPPANQVTELSEGRFIPGFVGGIVGMRAGESKRRRGALPGRLRTVGPGGQGRRLRRYAARRQAARPAAHRRRVRPQSIRESNPRCLKADVRRRLEAISKARERRAVGNAVMETLLASHEFPLSGVDGRRRGRSPDAGCRLRTPAACA